MRFINRFLVGKLHPSSREQRELGSRSGFIQNQLDSWGRGILWTCVFFFLVSICY